MFGARRNPGLRGRPPRRELAELLSRLRLRRDAQAGRHLPEILHRARFVVRTRDRHQRAEARGRRDREPAAPVRPRLSRAQARDRRLRSRRRHPRHGRRPRLWRQPVQPRHRRLRQPGSSFKPYVYTTALLNGFTPNSIVVDGPVCIGNWCPQNYGHSYSGSVTLTQAITRSINVVPVKLSIAHRPEGRRGTRQARPRQDRRGRAPLRPQGAAARHAVAADRLGRSHRARARRRLCDLPQPRQGGDAAFGAGSAHRRRRSGLALGPRRPEAAPGDPRLRRRRHGRHDEPRRQRRHRAPRRARRHSDRGQDRHDQCLSRRLVRRLHRQFRLRGSGTAMTTIRRPTA